MGSVLSRFSRVQTATHGLQPTSFLCPWEFSRQESWSGLPCPPPEHLPDPEIEPTSLMSPALAVKVFTTSATWEVPLQYKMTMKNGNGSNKKKKWGMKKCCYLVAMFCNYNYKSCVDRVLRRQVQGIHKVQGVLSKQLISCTFPGVVIEKEFITG